MNHSTICIYLEKNSATLAATLARKKGSAARIRVMTLDKGARNKTVFLIEAETNEIQKVIDSIAEGAGKNPQLSSSVVHCPECDSIRVTLPKKYEWTNFIEGGAKIFNFLRQLIGLSPVTCFECMKCGKRWDSSAKSNKGLNQIRAKCNHRYCKNPTESKKLLNV